MAWWVVTKWVVLPGVIAFSLMQLAKPSNEEIEKIKKMSKSSNAYMQVLQAAASPGSKPMYRQKPGEQHPVPELAKSASSSGVEK